MGLSGDGAVRAETAPPSATPTNGHGRPTRQQFHQFRQYGRELLEELDELREQLQPVIRELGEEIREHLTVVKDELQPAIQEIRNGVEVELADLRVELQPEIERIRQRLAPGVAVIEKKIQPHQERLGKTIGERLTAIDDRFQDFVQTRIDPLLGNSHRSQLQTVLNGGALTLRPEERMANRRLGLGLSALSLAIVSELALAPLMPLAIAIGMYASIAKYPHAVRQWKETGRIGAIHLICIYSLFLWLGGYATAGALGAVLYGLMLKAKAVSENQSRRNLVSLFQLQPDTVWIRHEDLEIEIPFDQLKIGDVLVAHAGQIIPVDGRVIEGAATVDQQMLTGEAQPVEKEIGDVVLASTLVISGRVDVVVEKTSAETTAGQIAAILNRAAQNSKPISVSAVAAADNLALPTLGLSLVSLPFIGAAGAVSLMGANTTTASYLSGSLAILNFLNLAARRRILVKESGALERLSSVDTIVFDKTGTLTVEQPHVAFIHRLGELDEETILTFAAAAEARQSHPIARAILAAAAERQLELPAIDDAHYDVGYGLRVRLASRHFAGTSPLIRVGSRRYMAMEGLTIPETVNALNSASQLAGHSMVMVAVDDELVGCLELKPTVRLEARQVIEGLRARGLALYIISGDQEAPTSRLANDLGMTGYFANVLPEGKAALVEKLQAGGRRVCFIGDGINDAIAMRQADVSISLRGATTVATDTAQIILMEGNLEQLSQLFELATEFERNLTLNIRYTSGISVVAVSGILFAGFTFYATEILYSAALMGGLGIALKPLLDHRTDEPHGREVSEQGLN
jgi:heavy metal translocating P-type ATPase